MFEDDQGAIEISRNPKYHGRMKHINIWHHFVQDQVKKGILMLKFCQSQSEVQKADIFTKALARDRFEKLRLSIGVQLFDIKDSQ